jgi:arginase family enzyme
MINEFLTPIDKENLLGEKLNCTLHNLVTISTFIKPAVGFDLYDFNLALIGVEEDRASVGNAGSAKTPDAIRKELYQLYMPPTEKEFRMIDLGNIKAGETVRDTYFALATVMLDLITRKVIPIIIGGSHDIHFWAISRV